MKRKAFWFLFLLLTYCWACPAVHAQRQKKQGPVIAFKHKEYQFGDIAQGDTLSHAFPFYNAGDEPIVITKVLTTCGCTAPSWQKKPIAPGDSSEILVVFDSHGKIGRQTKVISVFSNAQKDMVYLKLRGAVLPKDEQK